MTKLPLSRTRIGAQALAVLALLAATTYGANRGVLINAGDRVSTAIDPVGDTDDFVLDALAGSLLTVSAAGTKGSELVPALELLDPEGVRLPIDGALAQRKNGVTLKKYEMPVSGRYLLRVLAQNGREGAYQLKTKGKPPKPLKLKDLELSPGETIDIVFGGATDALLRAKIKATGGQGFGIVSVLDPGGGEVPGATSRFVTKGTASKATIDLAGGFGDYVVRVGDAPAATVLAATFKVKLPKAKRRKLTLSPKEPFVLNLDPSRGSEDDVVSVIGVSFQREPRDPKVHFGDEPAKSVSFVSSTELRVTVPPATGTVDVTVTNPDGQMHTRTRAFDVIPPPPAVTSLSPTEGPSSGGTEVHVFGQLLGSVTSLVLGGRIVSGPITVVDDGHLRFTTDGGPSGPAELRLIDTHGRSTTVRNAFTYLSTFTDVTTSRMPVNAGGRLAGGRAMALGDMDGDDDPDLLLANDISPVVAYYDGFATIYESEVQGLRMFLNEGGNFRIEKDLFPPPFTNNGDLGQARAMALGDLDGDKDLDLVVTSGFPFYGGSIYTYSYEGTYYYFYTDLYASTRVMLNDGSGNLSLSADALPDPTINDGVDILNAHALALGDLDKDGDLDLVLSHRWNAYTSYSYDFYSTDQGKTLFLTLFDAYDYGTSATRVLLNDGDGNFTDVTDTALPDVADGDIFAADAVLIGDVDKDGNADIVITSDVAAYSTEDGAYVSGSKTRILKGDGLGGFTNATSALMPPTKQVDEWGGSTLALGDLDDDGRPDLVLSTGRYMQVGNTPGSYTYFSSTRVFRGGVSGFAETALTSLPAVVNYWSAETWKATTVRLGDLDGDQDLDLILAMYSEVRRYNPGTQVYDSPVSSTRWLRNDGEGVFENMTHQELPDPAASNDTYIADDVALGDVDGDGDLDILMTGDAVSQYLFFTRPYATRQLEQRR